jgi:Arc/MetJ family transcription regulator
VLWYTWNVAATKPRVQVTLDDELAAAVAELGGAKPRSRAVHDLALRGAEAIRAEQHQRQEAIEFLRRLDSGEDDGYDFSVSEQLHAERR